MGYFPLNTQRSGQHFPGAEQHINTMVFSRSEPAGFLSLEIPFAPTISSRVNEGVSKHIFINVSNKFLFRTTGFNVPKAFLRGE